MYRVTYKHVCMYVDVHRQVDFKKELERNRLIYGVVKLPQQQLTDFSAK